MHLEPEIVSLPSRRFVGLVACFITPASPEANNMEVIPKLWEHFFARIHELVTNEPNVCYGLCECSEAQGETSSRPHEALYLAALQVSEQATPPPGMKAWRSPAGVFAKFIHRGKLDTLDQTMSFIYGTWLNGKEYERGSSPDLERYGSAFDPQSDTSEFEIYIPIKKRS